MVADTSRESDRRVLFLAPTMKDGELTTALLNSAGLRCFVCGDLSHMTSEFSRGAGAVLMTEEGLNDPGIKGFLKSLELQPAWSDLPVVILMRGAADSPVAARVVGALRNVTLLERPAPMRSVVSAVQTAVRGRDRQYEAREQIEAIRRAEARADSLAKERQRLLDNERKARAEAERVGRMKDDFLATLSHELRTPLNAILGWSQILQRKNRSQEDLDQGLAIIDRNTRAQAQLIEDLLDMSRITSGKVRLDVHEVNLAAIIEAALETARPAANTKMLRIEKDLDHSLLIFGDSGRLQQVFWNLFANAVKFTSDSGFIRVEMKKGNSRAEVRVIDNGQGIEPEFLPHVFERFRQADSSTTRQAGGLGLGLAIVSNLIEMHGGQIEVQSEGEGKGTAFIVTLPLSISQERAEAMKVRSRAVKEEPILEPDSTILSGIKVLVVDDEEDARCLVARVLGGSGAEVALAQSAEEALAVLKNFRADVLVSDVGMPGQDGYELIRQVRMLGSEFGGSVRAVALTAFTRSEDRTRAMLAGFQMHVAKPVDRDELIVSVANLAGRCAEPRAAVLLG